MKNNLKAVIYAMAAALFYALNIPLSKLLLGNVEPVFMAALLYFGAGLGVGIIYMLNRDDGHKKLAKSDLPYVICMILLDSMAPIFLMAGVKSGTSSGAALIGNFEIAATALFAMMLFHEKISVLLWLAIGLITLSGLIISYDGGEIWLFSKGSLLVAAATLCWGLENNCTRNISDKNTYQIVTVKGIFSGLCSLVTAFLIRERVPDLIYIFPALLLGFIAYGLSIFTYIRAQEYIGAAKTSAYYAAAPFISAVLSFLILNEAVSANYIAAFLIMLTGTVLVICDTMRQSHSHEHSHVFSHVHGGVLHTHVISHAHKHNHYFSVNRHKHKHTLKELESNL